MKHIICEGERRESTGEMIGSGKLSYLVERNWVKWPKEMEQMPVLNCCWGDDGFFYVVTGKADVPAVVFDEKGNYCRTIGQGMFGKSHSVRYTKNGTLLIADAHKNSHVIHEITTDGAVVRTFGTQGVPGDSGYDFDYLEVMEKNGEIPTETRWNKNAASNARIDSIKRRGMPFCRPCDMIMAPDGEYFAADGYGNCAVHHFGGDGEYLMSWGTPEEFRVVHSICMDRQGRLWVADRENCRVKLFDREGNLLAVVEGNLSRIGTVFADDRYLYIAELDGGITLIDTELLEPAIQMGAPGVSLYKAHGIAVDHERNIYLATNKANENNIVRLAHIEGGDKNE